jgi:hypothetical protein
MKKIKYLLIGFTSFLFFACQEEKLDVNKENSQNLSLESPLVHLISRVVQNTTAKDNVLDKTSCFKIELPVLVVVNGSSINVSSEMDYQVVQDRINAFSDDDDVVNFVFPITIVYRDFQKKTIYNASQLDNVLDNCDDDDGFEEIECFDINFPIEINVYNTNNQIANVILIKNDAELYSFITTMKESDLMAIKYPVIIKNNKDEIIEIKSNSDFEAHIEDCFIKSDTTNGDYAIFLTTGVWRVSFFFDEANETSNYEGCNFQFAVDGTVIVLKNTLIVGRGTWSFFVDDGQKKMRLEFDNSKLESLDEEWSIMEFSSSNLRLKVLGETVEETEYLNFENKKI